MIRFLLDLIYPRRAVCMGCGSMLGCERDDICDECREKLAGDWIGVRPLDGNSGLDGASFAYGYQGVGGNLVRRLKYGSVRVLTEEMGADIAKAAELLRIGHVDFVTAVPMHPKRLRVRGHNHGELLAKTAAERLNLPFHMALMRKRNDVQQVRLNDEQRRKNLDGAFAVRPEFENMLHDAVIVLIDDVYTTGATSKACAEALRAAGARKVYFAGYTLAKGKNRRKKNG